MDENKLIKYKELSNDFCQNIYNLDLSILERSSAFDKLSFLRQQILKEDKTIWEVLLKEVPNLAKANKNF